MKQEQLLDVFDGDKVAPGAGVLPFVGGAGGGLPEGDAPAGALVYGRGGVMTVDEMRTQGASGDLEEFRMQGGARRRSTRRRRRKQRGGTRKQKGARVLFNLRAQIRLRSRSQRRH